MNSNFYDQLYVVDSHLDIAWNASLGRDFLIPVAEWREKVKDGAKFGERLISLPDLLAAKHRLVIGTIFVLPQRAANWWESLNYATPEEAHELAMWQLHYYTKLAGSNPDVTLIRSREELANHFEALANGARKLGLIMSMEGADPITQPSELKQWFDEGLRLIGPSWRSTRYGGGTGEPGPLTPEGWELLAEMQKLGVILDVSHMAQETFYNALDAYNGTIIASHSNCRHFVDTDRHLTDDMLRRLIEREAVIGVVLYDKFLVPPTDGRKANLDDVVRLMHYICDIAGNTDHIAIGTDWDGGFGAESIPVPLTGVADMYLLAETLLKNNFSEDAVRKIFYGNWTRILLKGLP
jgi:membrane dipeptidase